MEKAAEKQKIPLIIDDAFGGLDAARAQLIGRMLKHLGTKAQVFHVSQQPTTAGSADAQVDLTVT
jgi:DNA repair ATPase RecN